MAQESIGALVQTAIPALSNAADIQAALRLYHYGSEAYNPANTSTASLVNPSIAYTLNNIQTQINSISSEGITDSIFTAKGDLLSASASSTPLILASGSNNQFLIVNTSAATGLQWSNTLVSPVVTGLALNDSSIIFEGSAADANETTLTVTNPTVDRTITLPDASGNVVLDTLAQTLTNKTLTTPIIDSISASAATGINPSLYPNTTTGNISIGAGLTTGQMNIATVGTGVTPISIGHTNATIGLTGNTTVTGTLTSTAAFQATTGTFTGATLAINGATPAITSTNASAASIFTSTVTGVTLGSSSIKSTLFPADGTTSTATTGAGYMGMPQTSTAISRSFAAADAGKHIYVTSSGTTQTIPANGTVAFPIGTSIVLVNGSGVSTTIAITTDTLRLANSSSTGSRVLASNGMCTLLKINSTEWIASGNGLT
jgi:hypothetical protein